MKKKGKTPKARATELDRIAAKLHTVLRQDTTSIIEKGKLLLRSRALLADEHGQWMPWLAENFDMSYVSALNYCKAAEYVARTRTKFTTVVNLSPSVLYQLADGDYNEQEEAAILAQAKAGKRVDQDRADAICEALIPPPMMDDDDDDDNGGDDDTAPPPAAEDPDIAAILDGLPPAVPPPAPLAAPPDYALRAFDEALTALKELVTKPAAQFASTSHPAGYLEQVEGFIRAVADRVREGAPQEEAANGQ